MAATAGNRDATAVERPAVLAQTFWELAGEVPKATDPVAVACAAARALEALERTDHAPHVTAATLTFLLRLDTDHVYAAPEQARGGKTNQRSLVFTVGVLVFEKLTGQHPFGALMAGAPAHEVASERIPPAIRLALDTAMAPFPADRWSSLRSLRNELERIVARERSRVVQMPRRRQRSTPPPCPGFADRRFARGSRPAPVPTAPNRSVTLEDAPSANEPPLVDIALLESKPWRAIGRSLLLMSVGAGLALSAVWLAQRPVAAAGAAVAVADAPAQAAAVQTAPVQTAPVQTAVVQTAPVDLPEIVVEVSDADAEVVAVPEVAADASLVVHSEVFDPDLAGAAGLAAMRDCFSESRLGRGVELSASLRFSRDDRLTNRVYYAPAQKLDTAERACVRQRLTGLSAGAAPERNAVISYTFWLSPKRTRFWAQSPR